jgi:insulysin
MRLSVRLAYYALLPVRSFVPLAARPRFISTSQPALVRTRYNPATRSYATVMNSVKRITDELEKPDLDDRSYRVIELPNKLEALLVHDPQTDKASASLNVNVGNFSDEEEMPGMAHAVEHLLFMGTEKVR